MHNSWPWWENDNFFDSRVEQEAEGVVDKRPREEIWNVILMIDEVHK